MLLLAYKPMVLGAYFARHKMAPTMDLSNDCVGVTGVGELLLEELFTFPAGDVEVQRAIEAFMKAKRDRERVVKELGARAALGGVKGLAAKNELEQLARRDSTSENRVEITLNAAKRRASGSSAAEALKATKEAEERDAQEKRRVSRVALAARAALFENGGANAPAPARTASKASEASVEPVEAVEAEAPVEPVVAA